MAAQHQPSGKCKSQYGWETVPFASLTILKNSKEGKKEGRKKKREKGRKEGGRGEEERKKEEEKKEGGRKKEKGRKEGEREKKKKKEVGKDVEKSEPPTCIAGCWLDCSAGLGSRGGKPSPSPGASMGLLRPPEAKSSLPAVTMARPFCNE